ncbi:MAG: hydrogenase maturation protease [Deltaproteobacteria bacterium]|nr:hydrogenase maturation protease [Deltaproteobacteria bacterium]
MKSLVLGVGNPIRGDDGVGLVVAERLCVRLGPEAEYVPFSGTGFDLLGWVEGFERVVIIDAMVDGRLGEGECARLDPPRPADWHVDLSSHRGSIVDAIALAHRLGIRMPGDVRWYGVGIAPPDDYREGLSARLQPQIDRIVEQIREDLDENPRVADGAEPRPAGATEPRASASGRWRGAT